jgi:hypothetical protein
MDSRAYVDALIAWYQNIDSPWLYQRLVDLRSSTGSPAYEDLLRLSKFYRSVQSFNDSQKIALIVSNQNDLARTPSLNLLFGTFPIMAFLDEADAFSWLAQMR